MDDSSVNGRIRQCLRDCMQAFSNSNADMPTPVLELTANDVMSGRGNAVKQHNQLFLNEVRIRHDEYKTGSDVRKTQLVTELKQWVRNREGRFLKRCSTGWVEMDEPGMNDKIRQCLRDFNSTQNTRFEI
jgi:hypothetical protein